MVPIFAIVVVALSLLLGALYTPLDSNPTFATQKAKQQAFVARNILMVTAHPDDEAMFFAPTILALNEKAAAGEVAFSLLCLSNGNAEGLGATRESEFKRSVDILGVPADRYWLVDHPELQDNMTASWDHSVIADVIQPYVLTNDIDTILTFDRTGVSSHPNHKAIPDGVLALIKNLGETSSKPPRLFTLVSASIFYKYISFVGVGFGKVDVYGYRMMRDLENKIIDFLGIWYSDLLTPEFPLHPDGHAMPEFISGYEGYSKALDAMQAHESQLLWFRWLYIAFSKYMWVNSWTQLQATVPREPLFDW